MEERYCRPLLLVKPQELDIYLKRTLSLFIIDLVPVMLPLSYDLFVEAEEKKDPSTLIKLKELEKELFRMLKPLLREGAGRRGVDPIPVIKAHATVIDYDLWLIDMVTELGFHGFVERLMERAGDIIEDFVRCLYSLFYVTMSVDLALLGDASYREDTLRTLVRWCSSYAKEVEDYLDTLIFLIPDEEYEAVSGYLKSEDV